MCIGFYGHVSHFLSTQYSTITRILSDLTIFSPPHLCHSLTSHYPLFSLPTLTQRYKKRKRNQLNYNHLSPHTRPFALSRFPSHTSHLTQGISHTLIPSHVSLIIKSHLPPITLSHRVPLFPSRHSLSHSKTICKPSISLAGETTATLRYYLH